MAEEVKSIQDKKRVAVGWRRLGGDRVAAKMVLVLKVDWVLGVLGELCSAAGRVVVAAPRH